MGPKTHVQPAAGAPARNAAMSLPRLVPGVYFRHYPFLMGIQSDLYPEIYAPSEEQPEDSGEYPPDYDEREERTGNEYAKRLKALLDANLSTTTAGTHSRRLDEMGGPGVEHDLVQLLFDMGLLATAAAAAYRTWKGVAEDIRSAVRRLRRLSRDHVLVDPAAAVFLAVDAVATPDNFDALDVRFVATIRMPQDLNFGSGTDRGYLVAVEVDATFNIVVIDPDGKVLGSSPAPPAIDFSNLGV